jgi:malonyl-CoA O-methyltransferase
VLDKTKLVRQFNAAARSYEDAAVLQRYAAQQLLERFEVINIRPEVILDLGSGTGINAYGLAKLFPGARIVQLDIAINMLLRAQRSAHAKKNKLSYLCADADHPPLGDSCVDLVYSNLMMQWCSRLDVMCANILRMLRNGGLFIFSSFGPDTLTELRSSWASVDDSVHVNDFMDIKDLGDILVQAGFADPVMETDYVTMSYENVSDLLGDLKKLGANNVSTERRRTLTGKNRFLGMQADYEKRREDSKLPATYEIVYGHAWVTKKVGKQSGSDFRISLDSLKGALSRLKGGRDK